MRWPGRAERSESESKGRQRGQAMTEYVLVLVALLGVGTLPVIPSSTSDELIPLYALLINMWQIYIDSYHAVIRWPLP